MDRSFDLTGLQVGRLTVQSLDTGTVRRSWLCLCECGNTTVVPTAKLKSGHTKSCGCLQRDTRGKSLKTHGMSETRIYQVWRYMLNRCYNVNVDAYYRYGGRGIKVAPEWHAFEQFYADMGDPPEGGTLERINSDADYSAANCKWATVREQARNRSSNRRIECDGESLLLVEWSERTGVPAESISMRIKRGWDVRRAIYEPTKVSPSTGRACPSA